MSPFVSFLSILAQTTVPTTQEMPGPFKAIRDMAPIILMVVIMFFFVFRGKKNADKKVRGMLDTLKKGDRVQTIGGIIGTVVEVRETEVVLKIDESTNTKMRFVRKAIAHVFTDDNKDDKVKG